MLGIARNRANIGDARVAAFIYINGNLKVDGREEF